MAYAKIKLNKDWGTYKAGEIIETKWSNANSLVADGAAEFVEQVESKSTRRRKALTKPPKDKMVRAKRTIKK